MLENTEQNRKFLADIGDKMPDEMKSASIRLYHAVRRDRKAREQLALWQTEQSLAEQELKSANEDYGQKSLRWDPETQTMQKLEELKQ